ncbi:MAG: amidohydrolase family protein [Abditibacteriales bacterium]|nr:amidohydrolase family protein [Abditibacteriales bacterium]MDW8366940.1 amidohydrolase family protein [Abditibacteriales bacterium]
MRRGILVVGIWSLVIAPSAFADTLAIRNAKIYTVSGGVIEGGTVLVGNGKIKAVGQSVAVPSDATVIDATGKVVMPGIVDANARFGVRGMSNEQASEITSSVRACCFIDPRSPHFKRVVQAGVTTACITPGTANVVGGLCAVVKTSGSTVKDITLRDAVAVRAALGADVYAGNSSFRTFGGDALANIYARRPNSRMATVWELRQALFQAQQAMVNGQKNNSSTINHQPLTMILKGDLPLRIHARIENDIRVALTIAEEFKLPRVILDEASEAYKVADEIAARQIPVVLGPFADPQYVSPEGAELCLNTAGILADKGVKVAFGSNGGDATQLLTWAAFAVRNGLKPDIALRAITLTAAEIIGVADRVGSIEVGKDADLLILNGEPLDVTTRIEKVIVNGRVVHGAE